MARSLGYQFQNAVDSRFGKNGKGGFDKHSMRRNKIDTTDKVFSYKERESLIKLGYQIDKFMRKNYPEIENVSEITAEHMQSFLNSKANTNNKNSLISIKSTLNKLDKVSSKRYKTKSGYFMNGVKTPKTTCRNNIRQNVSATPKDWSRIEKEMESSRSKANNLIRLGYNLALRVESLSNMRACDFDFKNGLVHIVDDKGNRDRTLKMTDVELCKKIVGVRSGKDRITNMKPDSINRQFKRLCEKAGITKFKNARTGIHALRKGRACIYAKELKDSGMDREGVLGEVSRFLGHRISRRDVLRKYLDKETIDYISK
ncbi:tyrosine-type recombinase/integrase [Clostridium perfringens]|nr:tyrosine-type recombinase/integrase [Clostridium perfringens]EJT6535641.1 tyrosine-type recombinase/integrase [Clostridium perfringens]